MEPEYEFDYDIWFEKSLRKERPSVQKSLVEFLKKETAKRHTSLRTPSKYTVTMKLRGIQFGIVVEEFIHAGFIVRTPSKSDISFVSDLLSKLTGYLPTLIGHTVKRVNLGISLDCTVNKSVVPTFIDLRNLADLGLKIRTDIKPMTVGFQSTTRDREFWTALTEHDSEYLLDMYLERDVKGQSTWDFTTKTYEEINTLATRVSKALGVKVLHG